MFNVKWLIVGYTLIAIGLILQALALIWRS